MESFDGQAQRNKAQDEEGRHLGPENGQSNSFEEDAPDDDQKIAQRIQIGKPLDNNRHIGNGKDEA